jgi:hypothetical protein
MAKQMICRACGHAGPAKKITKGSIFIEIIAWLMFLLPGVIYSLWRHGSRYQGCASCGSKDIVPADSPIGKQLQKTLAAGD